MHPVAAETVAPITLSPLVEFINVPRLSSMNLQSPVTIELSTKPMEQQQQPRQQLQTEPEKEKEEIVWSADTPPQVLVPRFLYYNMPFAVEIVIGNEWRGAQGVTVEDVRRSGKGSHVALEGAPDLHVTSCSRCHRPEHPVVIIGSGETPGFGPLSACSSTLLKDFSESTDDPESPTLQVPESPQNSVPVTPTDYENLPLEVFRFENCRAFCTSSRLHLGSRLIMVFHFLDKVTVVSKPFEVLSKRPRTGKDDDSSSDLDEEEIDQDLDDSATPSSSHSSEENTPSPPLVLDPTAAAEDTEDTDCTATTSRTTAEATPPSQKCLAQQDDQPLLTPGPTKKARLSDILTEVILD